MKKKTSGRELGPHLPTKWDKADARALQLLEEGKASAHQQRLALKWIIDAAGTYDMSYRPNDAHATTFAEGMRHVGLQIVKLLKININAIKDEEK